MQQQALKHMQHVNKALTLCGQLIGCLPKYSKAQNTAVLINFTIFLKHTVVLLFSCSPGSPLSPCGRTLAYECFSAFANPAHGFCTMAEHMQEELLAAHQQRQRTAHLARGPAALMLTSSRLLLELRRLSLLVFHNPTVLSILQLFAKSLHRSR